MQKNRIAIRIDDVFSSIKKYQIYGREYIRLGTKQIGISPISNFLFMKYVPGFRKKRPYREIQVPEWKEIFRILQDNNAKLTIGITAAWVEEDDSLTPFFEKFPQEAGILKDGLKKGIIEIANHGFIHCVLGKHKPRLFSSNRTFHREFWSWVSIETHRKHIQMSQQLLSQYFNCEIVTFAPPGNVWTKDTEKLAFEHGIKYLSSREEICPTGLRSNGLTYIGGKVVIALHDRDIVLNGLNWLEGLLKINRDKGIVTVQELGESLGEC